MGQRTQILLQVIDNKGNVKNKLYHYQWGFGKTMPCMLMRAVLNDEYLKNSFSKDFNYCDFIKMDGWDISDELDKADITTHLPLDNMGTMKRVLDGHDNNNGFMVVQFTQGLKDYDTKSIKNGFLKGSEDVNSEADLFKGYISAREYMETFKNYCSEEFIQSFELFCKSFDVLNLA